MAISGFNRATDAVRQPGSAFKPFVYLTALEHGHTPDDTVNDGPVNIHGWKPTDYEGQFKGQMPLIEAFAESSNSVAAQLTAEVGPEEVARTARRLGISSPLTEVSSLALGTSGVTPLELTGAYASFANGGNGVTPFGVMRVRTRNGKVLYRAQAQRASATVVRAHGRNGDDAPDEPRSPPPAPARRRGWRTGPRPARPAPPRISTTPGSSASPPTWSAACGSAMTTTAPMRKATGGTLPARMFHAFMTEAEQGMPVRPLAGSHPGGDGRAAAAGDDSSKRPSRRSPKSPSRIPLRRLLNGLFGGT